MEEFHNRAFRDIGQSVANFSIYLIALLLFLVTIRIQMILILLSYRAYFRSNAPAQIEHGYVYAHMLQQYYARTKYKTRLAVTVCLRSH